MTSKIRWSLTTACVCFVAGVAGFQLMHTLPQIGWLALVAGIVALCLSRKFFYPVFLIAGWCWAWAFAAWALSNRLPAELEGKTLTVLASIITIPQCSRNVCRFNALIKSAETTGIAIVDKKSVSRHVKLSWYYPSQTIKAGQHWLLTIRLKRPHGMMNPGGFDYEQWLFANRIDATGYVRCKQDCKQLVENITFREWIQKQRHSLYLHLQEYLEISSVSGLITGMTLGIRDDIRPQQWEVLRNTGTAHLMAISGLHVGLVAGLVFWILKRLTAWVGVKRWSPHQLAAIGAMTCAVGYALLAGLSVPTQRALIMLGIIFGSVLLQTSIRPFHLLALSAVVVVIVNPLAVLSAGFWLSFGAVVVISLLLLGRNQALGYWQATWSIGWRVALGLAPLLLLFFGSVSVVAPLANLIAVPIVSLVVVPVSLFGVVLSDLFEPLASAAFWLASAALSTVMWYLEQLSVLPFSTLLRPRPDLWVVALGVVGVLLLLSPKGMQARWLGIILLLPAVFPRITGVDDGTARITVLDVGQGLSSVIETANHTLVFDTGIRLSPKFDMGSAVLIPYLRSRAISQVDTLVLSHTDADHIGGANALLAAMPVVHEISSYPQQVPGRSVEYCEPGKQWEWDGVSFIILAPLSPYFNSENNNSCVIQVTAGDDSVLLTGDIEAEAEIRLVDEYAERLASTVLVAPHHGSKTSSSSKFLDAVQPELALIPAGYCNQYGFPHRSVVKRYQNILMLNTAHSGAISLTIGGRQGFEGLQSVTEYRHQSIRYWNIR
ncbi:MAG: DNA internalization-related competence protein ComEC/Rec2 [Methylococcales bacterium]